MALVDLEKTKFKFNDIKWLIGIGIAIGVGIWRFESQMADLRYQMLTLVLNQQSLQKDIINTYTIELLKINNRIDLLEAKKLVFRMNFKSQKKKIEREGFFPVCSSETNKNKSDEGKRHPQFCMILPSRIGDIEYIRTRFNLKIFLS